MSKPKRRLVLVTWRDAHGDTLVSPQGDYKVYTVGWLKKRGKRWTKLAGEKTPAGWRAVTRIPTCTVLRIENLG